MDLLMKAAQQFLASSGASGLDANQVVSALQGLLGEGGIAGIVAKLQGQGLQQLVGSWLGDGGNAPMSSEQVSRLFGTEEVSGFASELGIDEEKARTGLAGAIPALVDGASRGGSLLEAATGKGGLLGAAKGLFG